MRIAIFSDVHGNLTALETVLADIRQQAPDWTIFAGDLCVMGARPAACVALVREHAHLAVYGNTDEWLHTPPPIPDKLPEEMRKGHEMFHELLLWTREKLDADALSWLKNLPFSVRVSPTAVSTDDLLVSHANPQCSLFFPPLLHKKRCLVRYARNNLRKK
jgi:3',5'-cyclic AMP phosphodiesterase CpdA